MRWFEGLVKVLIFVEAMGDSAKVNLQDQIKEQGDVVRQLKSAKAPKEQVIFLCS